MSEDKYLKLAEYVKNMKYARLEEPQLNQQTKFIELNTVDDYGWETRKLVNINSIISVEEKEENGIFKGSIVTHGVDGAWSADECLDDFGVIKSILAKYGHY